MSAYLLSSSTELTPKIKVCSTHDAGGTNFSVFSLLMPNYLAASKTIMARLRGFYFAYGKIKPSIKEIVKLHS